MRRSTRTSPALPSRPRSAAGVPAALLVLVAATLLPGASGCGGSDGDGPNDASTSLAIEITSPAPGQTLTGTVDVFARVTGASGRPAGRAASAGPTAPSHPGAAERAGGSLVEFFVDGTSLGSGTTSNGTLFFLSWDTTTLANGSHLLRAVVTAGDESAEDQVQVASNNAGGGIAVVVTPSSATVAAGGTATFQAQVLGTPNASVTWSVDGGAANGTISSGGVYTAPTTLPANSSATVRATSAADTGVSGTATVVFDRGQGVTVTVDPPSAQVPVGQSRQFTATVTGTTNTGVTWEVVGGAGNGTISGTGLYAAPATVPNPATVTVRARSVADPSRTGSASVTVTGSGPIPPDELELLVATYSSGYNVLSLLSEINELVFRAIFFASCSNGNRPTLTGTLTESPPGSGQFTWSNSPADRLVIAFGNGQQYQIVVDPNTADGDVGDLGCDDWQGFSSTHVIDYTIQGPIGSLTIHSQKIPRDSENKDVAQSVQGSLALGGRTWNVDAALQGEDFFFIVIGEFGSSETRHDYTVTGQLRSGTTTIQLGHRQTFKNEFFSNGGRSSTEQRDIPAGTGGNGTVTFGFDQVVYDFFDTSDIDPVYQGSGTILRNGAAFGAFVVDRASGASGIQLLSGEIVPF